MKPDDNSEEDKVFVSPYDMLKFAESVGMTAKEFSLYAKKRGYSPMMVMSLTHQYMEFYQPLGTSKKSK